MDNLFIVNSIVLCLLNINKFEDFGYYYLDCDVICIVSKYYLIVGLNIYFLNFFYFN